MNWFYHFIIYYYLITDAFGDTDIFSCLHLRTLCKQIPECHRHLRHLESKCGISLQRCHTVAVSDCIHCLRSIRESLGVYSSNCWCYESLGAVRECEHFRTKIWSHPCEKRLSDESIKDRVSTMEAVYPAPLQNSLLLVEEASDDIDVFDNPETIVKRTTRSPMATEIRQWKNELNSALPAITPIQPALTCHSALYDICLKHISCRELWKIFRNSCTVDAQNQCRMSNRDDCWQSFEGISWTGLGNCTCHDRNSDCHWIRLQTNYNKCIYELSMAGYTSRNSNYRHESYVQQYQLHHESTSAPKQISISEEYVETTRRPATPAPLTTKPPVHRQQAAQQYSHRNNANNNVINETAARENKIRHDHHRQLELQRRQQEAEYKKRLEQQRLEWEKENEKYQRQKQERDRSYQEELKRRNLLKSQNEVISKGADTNTNAAGRHRPNNRSPWIPANVKVELSTHQKSYPSTTPPPLPLTSKPTQTTTTTTPITSTTTTPRPLTTTTTTTTTTTPATTTTTTTTPIPTTTASRINVASSIEAVEIDMHENIVPVYVGDYIRSSKELTIKKTMPDRGSTCGSAHKQCELNETCKWHLSEVQLRCITDEGDCVRTQCAAAMRRFSRFVSKQLGEAVAFCQCATADKDCKQLQHLMFPRCMYSYGQDTSLPTCTEVASDCKTDSYCNRRLPELNASCAVTEGSICKAKNIDDCRKSLMAIRGTALETPCRCQSDDKSCLALQSLMLPNNPCVEIAIEDYAKQHPEYLEPKVLEADPIQLNAEQSLDNSKYDVASQKDEDVSASSNVPPPLTNKKNKTAEIPHRSKFQKKRPSPPPSTSEQILLASNTSDDEPNYDDNNATGYIPTTTVKGWQNMKVNPLTIDKQPTQPPPPIDGCLARNIEGNWITHYKHSVVRQYNEWSGRCSEWCQCLANQTLYCKELPCLPEGDCSTSQTKVAFGERLYIDKRGACICISDEFICEEISAEQIAELSPGLYITLGYSKNELQIFKENVPKPIREVSGLVSPASSVVKDIVSRLQYTMEKRMPKGMLCRIIILKDHPETSSVMLQVQYYGLDIYTNVTEPKWQVGRMEKVCAPYVRQLEYIFLLEKAERYQLVLSAVKQIKVVDLLDGLPELSKACSMPYTHCSLFVAIILIVLLNLY